MVYSRRASMTNSVWRSFIRTVKSLHTAFQSPPLDLPSALTLLQSQPSHYVVASLYQRRYLLTPKDLLTVPHLKGVAVGDVIRLSKIHELGSRDYTLRGTPIIPPNTVRINATVVEHTKGPMEVIFKKKRRKGYQKHIRHKQGYTRLRIGPIEFLDDDLPQETTTEKGDNASAY